MRAELLGLLGSDLVGGVQDLLIRKSLDALLEVTALDPGASDACGPLIAELRRRCGDAGTPPPVPAEDHAEAGQDQFMLMVALQELEPLAAFAPELEPLIEPVRAYIGERSEQVPTFDITYGDGTTDKLAAINALRPQAAQPTTGARRKRTTDGRRV